MPVKSNYVISGYHIEELVRHSQGSIRISLDLGLNHTYVTKSDQGVRLPDGQIIKLDDLDRVLKRRHSEDCFLLEDGSPLHLYLFENNQTYKLYEPHIDWPPTLLINGGSVMHTVSVSKPTDEAGMKVRALGNVSGNILDCCFGLGYTAIELAKRGANNVHTCEISSSVIEIAKVNPWSQKAFSNKRISLQNADIAETISGVESGYYDAILHDPPNLKISGNLYSRSFYDQLYRVLKSGGVLYHFVGGGRTPREYKVDYTKGVTKRLSEAGFRVHKSYRGVLAVKA